MYVEIICWSVIFWQGIFADYVQSGSGGDLWKCFLTLKANYGATLKANYDTTLKMFAPGVAAGIHKPGDLAGYRRNLVFIRRSRHVPPSFEAVPDAMPMLFDLLRDEDNAAVRVVLGHFFFVYIHPYMDGNGHMGRFLMNAMLASGGYPWTVVPLARRAEYMEALEQASVEQDIGPFAQLLGELVGAGMRGEAVAKEP